MSLVTKQDYFAFRGVDLDFAVKQFAKDNQTKSAELFIKKVEGLLLDYMEENFIVGDNPNTDILKKAILYQIEYFLENGELDLYNPDNLPILSPNAYRVLRNNGMANTWVI